MIETNSKVCSGCLLEKPITEFSFSDPKRGYRKARCKDCVAAYHRSYYATNPAYKAATKARGVAWARQNPRQRSVHVRVTHLKKFGLTTEQYAALLQLQGGRCVLCGATEHGRDGKSGRHDGSRRWLEENWPIDHDHRDGRVRGLLCHKCNVRIGAFEGLRDEIGIAKVLEYVDCPSPVVPIPIEPQQEYRKHNKVPPRRQRALCSVLDCGKPHHAHGLCEMHNARRRRGTEIGTAAHRRVSPRGSAHPRAKLTEDDVRAIRGSDETGLRLAENYGVTATLITNIRRGRTWKHLL